MNRHNQIDALLLKFFYGDQHKVDMWWAKPNPMLGNISPKTMVLIGKLERLYGFIEENCSALETPVSTLCAICDQIKELHPSTHQWTAKETKGDANGPV